MAVLFCDTDSELDFKLMEELGCHIIKMPYIFKGEELYPEADMDMKAFFDAMRSGEVPTTAALNAANYIEYFEPYFMKGEDILYVAFGSPYSQTFNAMNMAVKELKEKYPSVRFECFDTKCISLATGLQVYIAGKLYKEGKNIDEILAVLKEVEPYAQAVIAVGDLKYLKRGGRVSALAAAFGTILDIKPVIKMPKLGVLEPVKKAKGRRKAIQEVINDTVELANTDYPIVVLHADCYDDCKLVHEKLSAALPDAEIWDYMVGPVIGAHCGPDTIATCYIGKEVRPDSKK